MELVRHYSRTPERCRGAVVAIGNFDGIHRGHQELIAKTKRIAEELGAPAAVMTFEPHPREFFKPDQPDFRLGEAALNGGGFELHSFRGIGTNG